MMKMELSEQEASAIRKQFGDFLTGKSTEDNVLLCASDVTMHTDDHTDNHQDSASS